MSPVAVPIPNLRRIEGFVSQQQGGGDGIMRGAGTEAVCVQTAPTSLSVYVGAFKGFVSARLIEIGVTTTTAAVVAPTGGSAGDLRRIDLVQFTLGAAGLNIKAGTEGAGPSAPAADTDSIEIAHLYLRKGMSVIKTADDATNGYVVDRRTFR